MSFIFAICAARIELGRFLGNIGRVVEVGGVGAAGEVAEAGQGYHLLRLLLQLILIINITIAFLLILLFDFGHFWGQDAGFGALPLGVWGGAGG